MFFFKREDVQWKKGFKTAHENVKTILIVEIKTKCELNVNICKYIWNNKVFVLHLKSMHFT